MKQQIKCPHCNKLFPIEETLKHEQEEIRKKLQVEEEKRSKKRQKEIEDKFNSKLEKLNEVHEKDLEKLRKENEKKQEVEAKNKRRMGLGITGLANAGEMLGYAYASAPFIRFQK